MIYFQAFPTTTIKFLGRKETQKFSGLKVMGLSVGVYYDCIVDDTKLGLEVIYDGFVDPMPKH